MITAKRIFHKKTMIYIKHFYISTINLQLTVTIIVRNVSRTFKVLSDENVCIGGYRKKSQTLGSELASNKHFQFQDGRLMKYFNV